MNRKRLLLSIIVIFLLYRLLGIFAALGFIIGFGISQLEIEYYKRKADRK